MFESVMVPNEISLCLGENWKMFLAYVFGKASIAVHLSGVCVAEGVLSQESEHHQFFPLPRSGVLVAPCSFSFRNPSLPS